MHYSRFMPHHSIETALNKVVNDWPKDTLRNCVDGFGGLMRYRRELSGFTLFSDTQMRMGSLFIFIHLKISSSGVFVLTTIAAGWFIMRTFKNTNDYKFTYLKRATRIYTFLQRCFVTMFIVKGDMQIKIQLNWIAVFMINAATATSGVIPNCRPCYL